jgi:hypothetical protein
VLHLFGPSATLAENGLTRKVYDGSMAPADCRAKPVSNSQ